MILHVPSLFVPTLRACLMVAFLATSRVFAADASRETMVLSALDLTRPELAPVATALKQGNRDAALKAFAAYLRERKNVHWQENPDGSRKTPPRFKKADADDAAEGKLQGGQMLPVHAFPNGDVDWHFDATAGIPGRAQSYEWQWQLNRMGFWTDLAGGYIATGDEKYARAFVKQMRSWVAQCPAPDHVDNVKGSAWRTIEAGIRMGWNWPTAYFTFVQSPSMSDEDIVCMVSSFLDHARYLRKCHTRFNFLTMEMDGLYAVGAIFPEFRESGEWREFAMRTLAEESHRQFLADGAQVELSTGYQNVAMDNILHAYEIARWNRREAEFPADYLDPMINGYVWQMGLLAPTYSTIQFNDSWKSPNLLRKASQLFPQREDFRWFATDGKEGKPPEWTSVFWNLSGFAAMRSGWDKQANCLIFRVGPAGAGHQHQDSLDLVLWTYGREMLFNNGGGNYDNSKWRTWAVSTYSHNCLIVDGLAQTRTFNWNDPMHDPNMVSQGPIDARWKSTPEFDFAKGVYDQGYGPKHLKIATQQREVLFLKPDLYVVADRLTPSDNQVHQYQARWQLLSTQTRIDPATEALVTTDPGMPNLAIVPLLRDHLEVKAASGQEEPEILGWNIIKGSVQKDHEPTTTLLHTRSGSGKQTLLTLLVPMQANQPFPIAKIEPGSDGASASVTLHNGTTLWISCAGEDGIQVRETLADGKSGRRADLSLQDGPGGSTATAQDGGPETTEAQAAEALDLDAPGMEGVKGAVQSGSLEAMQKAYLQYRRSACPAKWKVSPASKPIVAAAQEDPVADELCHHILNDTWYHIVSFPVDMGKNFNWTHNPLSPTDPDYTMEFTWAVVSRMHFWKKLADGYWKTLNEKYAREWVAEMLDFCQKNKRHHQLGPGEPSLWRTLDASERMYDSWPYAYYYFLNSPEFTPEAQWVYLRSIIDHAELLQEGLRTPGRKGNWVTSECFGLYTLGVLFPELKAAQGWRQYALERLVAEVNESVPPDGFEAELTPGYHYFALSCFIGPLKLAKLNGLSIPDELHSKILSMYQAPVLVMDQAGKNVPTNDSWNTNAVKAAREGLELMGNDPLLLWATTQGKEGKAPPDSTMLPYAGFYAMRSGWKPDDVFLFFRAGPTGFAHDHEDMLEVVLRAWNKTLLFDPGSYRYDHSQWRRYAIGTASHNTILVDGKWQHRGASMPPVPKCENPWFTTPLFDYASGCYKGGYQKNVYDGKKQYAPQTWEGKPDFSVSHTRHVLFLKPWYALLVDTLDGTGAHQYEAHFHLDSPSAKIDPATQTASSQNATSEAQLALFPLDREGLNAEIIQGREDPMLGWMPGPHRPTPAVCYSKTQQAPATFATFLYPYKDHQPALSAAPLEVNDGGLWATSLTTPNEQTEIVIAKDDKPHTWHAASKLAGAIEARSTGLMIRHFTAGDKSVTGCWGTEFYRDSRWSFKLSRPATLLWSVQDGAFLVQNADPSQPVVLSMTEPFVRKATLQPGAWVALTQAEEKRSASPLTALDLSASAVR